MKQALYVPENHILRTIWGKADSILLIFAGSAAEFALNKAVDWLYFTGKLPADPLGRLFSTVAYARNIIFAPTDKAHMAIDQITRIHRSVEAARSASIPDWAYRDVLFMLIHYSIAAAELLDRPLRKEEKEAVYEVFLDMGRRMQIPSLPENYTDWLPVYQQHLSNDLIYSALTKDLFGQYKKHLGLFRYRLLLQTQQLIVPATVAQLLSFGTTGSFRLTIPVYRLLRKLKADPFIQYLLIPGQYRKQVSQLNLPPTPNKP